MLLDNSAVWQVGMTLENLEREVILRCYRYFRGNKTTCAASLGIAIRTLDNKLEKYGADDKEREAINAIQKKRREEFAMRQRGLAPAQHSTDDISQKDVSARAENVRQNDQSVIATTTEQTLPLQEREVISGVLPEQVTNLRKSRAR